MLLQTIQDIDITSQRLIIRQDFNVPIKDGCIQSHERIKRSLPTIKYAMVQGSGVVLFSHLGNPQKEPTKKSQYSLQVVADALSSQLKMPVKLIQNIADAKFTPKTVQLLENTRFFKGETTNSIALAKQWAKHCDIFVMDAFGAAHREHASTAGMGQYAKKVCAGLLLEAEIQAIDSVMQSPKRPLLAIVGGAKISTKIHVLKHLADIADHIIIGGAMANTCLAAQGIGVGQSLYEPTLIEKVRLLLDQAKSACQIYLPADVKVAKQITDTTSRICSIDELKSDESIFDIGSETLAHYQRVIESSQTIVWNGPLGAFEYDEFCVGTYRIAKSVADCGAHTVVGGGDTIHALECVEKLGQINFVSTGGSAFLDYLSGRTLPGIKNLMKNREQLC